MLSSSIPEDSMVCSTIHLNEIESYSSIDPATWESLVTFEPTELDCPHYIMSYSREPGNCNLTDEVCLQCLRRECDVLDYILKHRPPSRPWFIDDPH
jgi:hypothetical protein